MSLDDEINEAGREFPIEKFKIEIPDIPIVSSKDSVISAIKYIEKVHDNAKNGSGAIVGIPTGFVDLDKTIGGLQGLVVLGARPEINMSAFALNIAEYASVGYDGFKGCKVVYVKPGEDHAFLTRRMLLSKSRVNLNNMVEGFLCERDYPKLTNAAGKLANNENLKYITSFLSMGTLQHHCEVLQESEGLDLVIIDKLQNLDNFKPISGSSSSMYNRVQEIKYSLMEMKSRGIAVLVLSEMKKKQRKRDSLETDDLRDWGILEYESSPILLLERDEENFDNLNSSEVFGVNINVRNNYWGKHSETINLIYLSPYGRFESATKVGY
ncbi:hypothetical protein COU54_05315 [Candidatus Pacearchaeota archaeon CG10_big_fil_rev_8_21_14_0_10_31_24]|nr:MAG: hypothetical protein COU54_05315 [Candidatus Pacearchaeota archaeon CG10_big_fil_rev_8_21_14_0_10_31_24]